LAQLEKMAAPFQKQFAEDPIAYQRSLFWPRAKRELAVSHDP
jgi:hypothetical protein